MELVRGKKCFATLTWPDLPDQWMADEFRRYACIAEEFLFEWKNTQRQRESPSHDAHAPGPPRPELRADVVNVANTDRLQFAGQPQMEAGEICQDCQLRTALFRGTQQSAHRANQLRKV